MRKNNFESSDKFINKIKDNLYFKQDNFYDLFAATPLYRTGTKSMKKKMRNSEIEGEIEEPISISELNSESTNDLRIEKHTTFKLTSRKTPSSITSINNIDRKKFMNVRMKSSKFHLDDESDILSKHESIINSINLKSV